MCLGRLDRLAALAVAGCSEFCPRSRSRFGAARATLAKCSDAQLSRRALALQVRIQRVARFAAVIRKAGAKA